MSTVTQSGSARRAGALAAVVAADAAAGCGGRGGGQRGRERGGGTSPGGPPVIVGLLLPGLSARSSTSADGSPFPTVGWAVRSDRTSRDPAPSPGTGAAVPLPASAPATTTSARGSVGPPVSSIIPLGARFFAHLGRRCLHDVDPRLRQQDVEVLAASPYVGMAASRRLSQDRNAPSFSRSVPVKSVDPQ